MKAHLKKRSKTARRKSVSRFVDEASRRGWYSPAQWATLKDLADKWKNTAEALRVDLAEHVEWEKAAKSSMHRALVTKPDDIPGRIAIHVAFAGFCGLAPDEIEEPINYVDSINKQVDDVPINEYVDPIGNGGAK